MQTPAPAKPQRKPLRLKDFDYQARNAFFVTLCSANRACLFGTIHNGVMHPSPLGTLAQDIWHNQTEHVSGLELLDMVLMPNHLHGIVITPGISQGLTEDFGKPRPGSLPTIMRNYKAAVTRFARRQFNVSNIWQPRYYEHVIRDEWDYQRIAEYIAQNPLKWHMDKLYQE